MPVKQIVRGDPTIPSDFRDLVGNMVYVGILAHMINIELDKIQAALFPLQGQTKAHRHEYEHGSSGHGVGKGKSRKEGSLPARANE